MLYAIYLILAPPVGALPPWFARISPVEDYLSEKKLAIPYSQGKMHV